VTAELRWCTGHLALVLADRFGLDDRGELMARRRECRAAGVKAWREANPEAVDAYNADRRRDYAEARGSLERECANPDCGRTFTPSRKDAKTCSQRCRDRLAYLRRKAAA